VPKTGKKNETSVMNLISLCICVNQLRPYQMELFGPMCFAAECTVGADLDAGGQLDESAFGDAGLDPVMNRRGLYAQGVRNLGAATETVDDLLWC
jgi:hypothetical protein